MSIRIMLSILACYSKWNENNFVGLVLTFPNFFKINLRCEWLENGADIMHFIDNRDVIVSDKI